MKIHDYSREKNLIFELNEMAIVFEVDVLQEYKLLSLLQMEKNLWDYL